MSGVLCVCVQDEVKELTCFKCYHKGVSKTYWKGGNYMIWYKGCEKCSGGVFIQ